MNRPVRLSGGVCVRSDPSRGVRTDLSLFLFLSSRTSYKSFCVQEPTGRLPGWCRRRAGRTHTSLPGRSPGRRRTEILETETVRVGPRLRREDRGPSGLVRVGAGGRVRSGEERGARGTEPPVVTRFRTTRVSPGRGVGVIICASVPGRVSNMSVGVSV